MVRTVTRKTPNTKTTWYRLGKSANTGIKRSSSSRRKELVKLKSMKKVTKRVLEEKLKRAYLRDGSRMKKNEVMNEPSRSSSPRRSSPPRFPQVYEHGGKYYPSSIRYDGSFKACPPGKTRSRKGHCVKIWSRSPRRKSLNPGYELNRKTGRLRKVCPSGKKRSRKGRCVKI
jgi:hypothetical protein